MSFTPLDGRSREVALLAPYGMASAASQGRRHPEPASGTGDAFRPPFQRDRERVVHCRAFRRLTSKTQVLVAQTNDHHRTRLTHSLEVAQVSRTFARMLGLNEDLVEAVALSHDLGHPPFGHAGERALDDCLRSHGGFDHNLHALHIVDDLEHPYPAFPGLNLSWEVRSAFAYHSKRADHPAAQEFAGEGEPLLEFQAVDFCDSLAYDTHDLDDALGANIIGVEDVEELEFWKVGFDLARQRWPQWNAAPARPAVVRALFEWQVLDLVAETRRRLDAHGVASVDDVRRTPNLVDFSPPVRKLRAEWESFLRERVYRNAWVMQMAEAGNAVVGGLFAHYLRHPDELPPRFAARLDRVPAACAVGDYIAGMTDRYADHEFRRLCRGPTAV